MGHHERGALLRRRLEMQAVPSPTNKPAQSSEAKFEFPMNAEQALQDDDFNDFVGEQEFLKQGFEEDETEFDDYDFRSELQKFQY